MKNLKIFVLLLAISIFSIANIKSLNALQQVDVKKTAIELKKLQLQIPVQSGVYSDGNCDYWFTATLIYTFDDQTGMCTSISSTSPTLHYSCQQTNWTMYARGVEPIFTINGGGTSEVSFLPTGDSKIDQVLNNQNFIDVVKKCVNENIKK